MVALRDLLTRLPADVRYRVLEIRLDQGRFTLEGQVNSHGDADAIAAGLREGGKGRAFSVELPRTEQPADAAGEAGKAVSFTIDGEVASGPAGTREGAR